MLIFVNNTLFHYHRPNYPRMIRIVKFPHSVLSILMMLLMMPVLSIAQEDPALINDEPRFAKKGFHAGLFIGAYFPNSNSAGLYDGYGFDADGNRNTFDNSWMKEKIANQFGGGYGNIDQIAIALGVQPSPGGNGPTWYFTETDMPFDMRFKTAISVGFNGRYSTDGRNAVLMNVNAAIIKAVGNFTIVTEPPPNSTQINRSIQTFDISGSEQRLLMQLGYQHLFGEGGGMYFLMEGGLHATLARFDKNEIRINDLIINLYEDYNPVLGSGQQVIVPRKSAGVGFGAFGGIGLHFETSGNWNIQFVYNPLLERVSIAYNPKYSLSHSAGLRAYYKL